MLRSLSYGVVPVIYANPGSTNDIIHRCNGLVASSSDPSSLVSSVYELYHNPTLLRTLSENAREYSLSCSQSVVDQDFIDFLFSS